MREFYRGCVCLTPKFELVKSHSDSVKKTFETEGDFYCLIDTAGSNSEHDEEVSRSIGLTTCQADSKKLSALLEHLMEEGMVLDGVLAQDTTQFQSLWSIRESAAEAAGKTGSVYKYDVSVPVPKMYSLVEKMRARLREAGIMEGDGTTDGAIRALAGYGHMGDGEHCAWFLLLPFPSHIPAFISARMASHAPFVVRKLVLTRRQPAHQHRCP